MNQFHLLIDDSSTYDDSDYGSISTNTIEDIWDGSQIHLDNNKRYARLKYVTILIKRKVNGKYNNSHQRG